MYIWKTTSLATDIKNGSVGANEWKNYYLTLSIFVTLSLYLTALAPRENMLALLIEIIAVVGVLIFGVSITFRSNGGNDGVDYIPRMTALSLPVLVKVFLGSLLAGIISGIVGEAASLSEAIMEWLMVGFVILIQVIFFWRLDVHIKHINS